MRFEFTVRLDGAEHDVLVRSPAPPRVSEIWPQVLASLGSPADVRPDLDPGVRLGSRQLATGAVIRATDDRRDVPITTRPPDDHVDNEQPGSNLAVHIVGGRDAGRSVALRPGSTGLGRDPHSAIVLHDQRVSRHHVTIRADSSGVTLFDDGSTNGTTIEGLPLGPGGGDLPTGAIARIGDTLLAVHGDNDTPLPTVSCGDRQQVAPVSRPPCEAPRELDIADRAQRAAPRPTQWLAALLPAVAGAALAWLTHSPSFLLFALLSPVMLLGTALGDRIHWRRSGRADDVSRRARDATDEQAVRTALRTETAARRARHPDPVVIGRAATVPTTTLWQRRAGDEDALALRIGTAGLMSSTRLRRGGATEPAGRLTGVPVTVDLRDGPVGFAGPADVLDGLARSLVAQLAVLHPPNIVELALFLSDAAGEARWWWARWLPHLGDRVARSAAQWRSVADRIAGPLDGRWTVAILDRTADPSRFGELTRLVADVRLTGVTALVFGDSPGDLPTWCVRTIDLWAGRSGDANDLVLDQVSTGWAEQVARSLAPLSVAAAAATGPPDRCHLLDLLDFETPTATEIRSRWAASDGRARTVLGSSAEGRLELDLGRDGPHVLVAGTTGSGKSELLRSLVLGMALQHPPDELSFVLVDYKGGAAFAECSVLPHVVGSVTDLDPHLTRRALHSLEAELRRRERLFAATGASDLDRYRRASDCPLARLVIVVDEFAALADTLPDFLRGLVAVAQRGRSLGVHLVLATQRPGTAVTPEIRANTACRIALRVIETAESAEIIGVPDAARLPPRFPGRALMRGAGAAVEFQVAGVDGVARDRVREVSVERLGPWRQRQSAATPSVAADTSCAQLVEVIGLATAGHGVAPGAGPWLAPLPALVPARSLTASGPHRVPIGLIDRPSEQRQDILEFDLDVPSSWLVVGSPRSGRTSTLLGAALTAAGSVSPSELEIYVIDADGPLAAALRELPHVATCLGPDELDAVTPLLRRLSGRSRGSARVLLLIDRGDRVLGSEQDAAVPNGADDLTAVLGDRRVTVLAAGSRALLTARATSGLEHRLVLRLSDRADYALVGIPARDVPAVMPPGRAIQVADGAVLQLAHPGGAPGADAEAVRAVVDRWRGGRSRDAVRIRPLPRTLELDELPAHPTRFRLGVAGESAEPLHLDPFAGSGRWLVAGPARSGRTTTLLTLLAEACRLGVPVLVVAPTRSALFTRGRALGVEILDPSATVPRLPGVPPRAPILVLVDDCESFNDSPIDDALAGWARGESGLSFVVAGRSEELAAAYRGLAVEVRRARSGVLLRPGPLDGELFDTRLPRSTDSPPGRGLLVGAAAATGRADAAPVAVQVARP